MNDEESSARNPDERSEATSKSQDATADAESTGLIALPIDSIVPNANQPRRHFDEAAIDALAASIRSAGLMQPIVVRPRPPESTGTAAGKYELIAGERRWRAAKKLGLKTIPAVIREVDDRQAAEWALIENLQREDLNPIERAEAFQRLVTDFGLTHQEVAEQVGFDRTSITNHLRLLELDRTIKDFVEQNLLSQGHGRALLAITNIESRRALALQSVREGWSVRELERRVRSSASGQAGKGSTATTAEKTKSDRHRAHMDDLERRLGEHLGTRVAIQTARKKGEGKLVIGFYSLDQFEGLLEKLDFRYE